MDAQLEIMMVYDNLNELKEKLLSIKTRQENDLNEWESKLRADGKTPTPGQLINIEIRRKDIEQTRKLFEEFARYDHLAGIILNQQAHRHENSVLKSKVQSLEKENKVMREMLSYRGVNHSHIQQTIMYSRPQDFQY